MSAHDDTLAQDELKERKPRMRRRRKAAIGLVSLALLAVGVVIGFVGLVALRAEPLQAPDWVQERLEREISRAVAPYEVSLGRASIVIEDGWSPRVTLGGTELKDAAGARLVSFDAITAGLKISSIWRGDVKPVDLALSGTRLSVRRDKAGAFWLSFDEALGGVEAQTAGFMDVMREIDTALARDVLSGFNQLELTDVTLRYEDERAGRNWTVDGGRLELLVQDGEMRARADFALLTGGATAAGIEMSFERALGANSASIGLNLSDFPARDLASQSAALSWLEALNAPISGALRVSMTPDGGLGPLNATLQIGAGALKPNAAAKPVPFQAARTYLKYDPANGIVDFDEITVESEWVTLSAFGKLGLVTSESGWPEAFVGQLTLGKILANPTEFLSHEVTFDSGFADLRLTLDPFRVELGQLGLQEAETKLFAQGRVEALEEGWSYRVQASGEKLEFEKILGFWPKQLNAKTRDWVAENILSGRIREAQFALRSEPNTPPDPYLSFGFEDVRLRFIKTMPLIEGLEGHANLLRKRFSVRSSKGYITAPQGGRVDVSGTEFIIPQTKPKPAKALVKLRTSSQITGLLSVLDEEPLNLLSKAGQPVTVADGAITVDGELGWVMTAKVDPETVRYDLSAVARQVRSVSIVPGKVLAAPRLNITAAERSLTIEGTGRLGALPVSGSFKAPLGKGPSSISRVNGTIELSSKFIDEFKIGLPRGSVGGTGQGQIALEIKHGEGPKFKLSSDLKGVELAIPQIGWRKAGASKGRLEVVGQLGSVMSIDQISLRAGGLEARGDVALSDKGVFEEARFGRVTIGSWLDVPLRIKARSKGQAPQILINGGRLDLSQTSLGEGSSSGSGGGGPISARLDELKISDGIALQKFQGNFQTAQGFAGDFTGLVNGQARVTGRVVPQSGRSAFRIQSDNGGAVLKAAGLLKNASGGSFDLTMAPALTKGSYNGALEMKSVRLKDAPAMAELLNAISVVGLLEQLGGSGILFNEVEARFQLTPSQVVVSRSSAVGSSMGISMDGFYNLASGAMDMQGVVSPFFILNGVGQIFTRKGEGLVGFNYNLRGTASAPKVQVNPLSLFTPGMFREIFRRPAPEVER